MADAASGPGAIMADGRPIAFRRDGRGRPLVFVHGSISDHDLLDAPAGRLARRFEVVRPTMSYFGASPWPDAGEAFSADRHADEVAALVEALGLGPADLIGWSYGGAVCLRLATARPDLVRSMLLYEPSLFSAAADAGERAAVLGDRDAMFAEWIRRFDRGELDRAVEAFVDGVNDMPGRFADFDEATRTVFLRNARTLRLLRRGTPSPSVTLKDLRRIEARTGVMVGAMSRETWRIGMPRIAEAMPNAELIEPAGARHLWPIEDPDAFADAAAAFFDARR